MSPNRASTRHLALVRSTLPVLLAALPAAGADIAIVGAVLIDGTGTAPLPGSVVVVEGDRIRCAGPAADCPIPAGAERIEASGLWFGPGLIDTHVHVNWSRDPVRASLQQSHRLGFGITTVRERWNDPRSPTPRLVVSGRASARESGSGNLAERVRRLSGLGAGLSGISHLPSIPLLASRDDAVLPAAPGHDPAPGA
jgi:hypothetical protein